MIVEKDYRYEVGDEVYITDEWESGDGICVQTMEEYQGKIAKIMKVVSRANKPYRDRYRLDIDSGRWNWEGFCFEQLNYEDDTCDIDLDESAFAELLGVFLA